MSKTNIHEVPETFAVFERTLPDGNRLEYRMQVLQQPERARACGMGAKSHADRRPVDPPPVVELRLFQGNGAEKADVTFSHNSNFLLFATLEQARPIAQGRGMPAPAPQPVLTGVPVSGMAYLDRPAPAGYFIFPDLSVRHEGKYRLRFALYEETKEEIYPPPADPLEPKEFCTHRLDVKSKAFTVFSAKKFPGLAESTALSRIVAEQGCRVRIRRDVRMRRRSDRPRRDSEECMDETQMLRAQRAHTPDQYEIENSIRSQNQQPFQAPSAHPMQRSESTDRKRSGSDASMMSTHEAPAPPRFEGTYGTSMPNHGQYAPSPAAPATASHHLSFGGNHGVPPAPPQVHPPQIPAQDMYNQSRYPQSLAAQPRAQQYPTPVPSYNGSREGSMAVQGQQIQQQPMNAHQMRRESVVDDYRARRESNVGYTAMPTQQQATQQYRPSTPAMAQPYGGQMQNGYVQQQPAQQQHYQHQQMYQPQTVSQPAPPLPAATANALPPLRLPEVTRLPALEPRLTNGHPTTPSNTVPPALPSPSLYGPGNAAASQQRSASTASQIQQGAPVPKANQFPAFYTEQSQTYPTPASSGMYAASNGTAAQPPAPESKKRQWGRVFNEAHTAGPMHDKMRPSDNAYGTDPFPLTSGDDDDSAYDIGKLQMSYRRADGVEITRKLPGDHD